MLPDVMQVQTLISFERAHTVVHQVDHTKGTLFRIVGYLYDFDSIVKDATGLDAARPFGSVQKFNSTFQIKEPSRFGQILGDIVSGFSRLANRFDKTTSISTGDLDPGVQ